MGFWPAFKDQTSIVRGVERAVRFATISAVLNAGIGIISIVSNSQITEREPLVAQGIVLDNGGHTLSGYAFLFVGLFFGLVAWKIRSMSRGWAFGGLILSVITLLTTFAQVAPSPLALVFQAVVIAYFINAVRATLAFQRMKSEQHLLTSI